MSTKAVIIGSGVGGSACAALLARAGWSVTVLESHPFTGGRCASFDREGFRYDFGVHMFSRGDMGPHGEVNRRIGGGLRWATKDPACRIMGASEFFFPLDIKPLRRLAALAMGLGVKARNIPGAYRLIRSLLRGADGESNDTVCLRDYVSRFTDDEAIHRFITCVSQLYFALSYESASAGEFIYCFSRMFQEASFGYPVGGSASIPGTFLERARGFGCMLLLNTPVLRIVVEGGRARGVETASGHIEADHVISNAGVLRTIELAGSEHFPPGYVSTARSYAYSNSYVTIKYGLARPVIPYPVVFVMPDLPAERVFRYIEERTVPEDPYLFMPVPTHHDPALAPAGKQLVIAGTAAPAGASEELCNAILDRVDEKVRELFPALPDAVLWTVRSTSRETRDLTGHAAGEAIGLAQTPQQVGRLRPACATPVSGLWLVGADAGARGIGTEMASQSALALAETLLETGRRDRVTTCRRCWKEG
jgi:phytoene dehydrogenase-like protein